MKKKLLLIAFASFAFTNFTSAQTKTWDFGNDDTTWPLSAGIGSDPKVVDNLGLFPISTNTNFAAVTAQNNTFSDGFTSVNRFQMNGGGGAVAPVYMPTQRYLFFNVDSDCVVKVWFKTGSNGASRTIFVTDGTALYGSATTNSGDNTDTAIVTANYTGTGGTLYIYGDNANNLMKVEVDGANVETSLGVNDFQSQSLVKVHTNGKQVSVDNVISKTEINVYSITGALVKSINTNTNTSFNLSTAGLYIVRAKSAEGVKTTKLAIR